MMGNGHGEQPLGPPTLSPLDWAFEQLDEEVDNEGNGDDDDDVSEDVPIYLCL